MADLPTVAVGDTMTATAWNDVIGRINGTPDASMDDLDHALAARLEELAAALALIQRHMNELSQGLAELAASFAGHTHSGVTTGAGTTGAPSNVAAPRTSYPAIVGGLADQEA